MRQTVRAILLAALFLVFGVASASGQTFELFASGSDLDPGSGNVDAQCITRVSSDVVVFFNSEQSAIFSWDGSTLTAHTDSTTLNSNVDATSNVINRCDAVARDDDGNVYFSFRASNDEDQPNYIYKTEISDASNFTFMELDGSLGLAVRDTSLYIASYAFFEDTGEREDGIYRVDTDLSGSVSAVATNPDLSIDGGLDISASGVLYTYSNDFAGDAWAQVLVSLDITADSPSFEVFADPYSDESSLTAGGDNISDVDVVTYEGSEFVVVHNANSDAQGGEEFATVAVADQSTTMLFTSDLLTGSLSIGGYTSAFARALAVGPDGSVFTASGGGGAVYIAKVSSAAPLPVEMASFDGVHTGSSVRLTWETASETNNAGFRVQHQVEGDWRKLGYVESKAVGGTTTEAQSYRFALDENLDPGTHKFRLVQVDVDGTTHPSDVVTVDVPVQNALTLSGPSPNPTSGPTNVSVTLKQSTNATVVVYNVLGRKVATLFEGVAQGGETTELTLETRDLPSGIYFVRLQAEGRTKTRRLTVVR